MKGYLSRVALLLLFGYATAMQLRIKSIEYRYPGNTEMQYRVPWFSSTDNPKVAKRTNDYIFANFINQLPGNTPQATINQFAKPATNPAANLDYTVEYCGTKILTLNIFTGGCGVYYESHNIPINFDLVSGAVVILNGLFSRATIAESNTLIGKNIHGQVDTFVTAYNSQTPEQIKEEKSEDFNCVELYASYATYTDGLHYTDRFSLQKDHLVSLNERYNNHTSRALDELGDFTTKIPTTELQNRLTSCSQYLTTARNTTPVSPAPSIDDKAMYGTLEKSMRIVLGVDCRYGDFFEGTYLYQKFGAPTELTGKCDTTDNQRYELKISAAE